MNTENLNITNIYVRANSIYDVIDRLEYISTYKRQKEKLIAVAGNKDLQYWQRLALECNRSGKNSKRGKAVQGRELIVNLPNSFLFLEKDEQNNMLKEFVELIDKCCGTSCLIAAHNSKPNGEISCGNAHLHILISERPILHNDEIRRAKRNLFYDSNHHRCERKSDILTANGKLKDGAYIIKKGDITNLFDSKYDDMSSPRWTKSMKKHLASFINQRFQLDLQRVVYTNESPFIPQNHIGKGHSKEKKLAIQKDNAKVKAYNYLIQTGNISLDEAMFYKDLIMLSPERGREAENIYRSLYHEDYPEEFDMPELMASVPRTSKPLTAEELKKREMRKLYRLAQIERNLEKEAKTESEKKKHQKQARHYSAEIDRMKKASGIWSTERYCQELKKEEEELERLRSLIEHTKYLISVYANQYGDISLAKYRLEKRNLSDLYSVEKSLIKQVKCNMELLQSNEPEKIRKMDFSKIIESAEARRYAQEQSSKDGNQLKEAVFGTGKDSKAQAIIDAAQIQEKLGISSHQELMEALIHSEKNLVRLKEALARYEDMVIYFEKKKRNCDKSELVKCSKYIIEYENEQKRINDLIVLREKEYLELRRALYGRNICEGIAQEGYQKRIDYGELFDRHKMQIDYDHREQ